MEENQKTSNENKNENEYKSYTEDLHYDANAVYLFPSYQVNYIDVAKGVQYNIILNNLSELVYWVENNLALASPYNICHIKKVYTIQE